MPTFVRLSKECQNRQVATQKSLLGTVCSDPRIRTGKPVLREVLTFSGSDDSILVEDGIGVDDGKSPGLAFRA